MTVNDYAGSLLTAWANWRGIKLERCSRYDRAIARRLCAQGTPLVIALAAIQLAAARLESREQRLPPLPPPRSLAYLLPVIEELRNVDPGYLAYLSYRLVSRPNFSGFE